MMHSFYQDFINTVVKKVQFLVSLFEKKIVLLGRVTGLIFKKNGWHTDSLQMDNGDYS